ncbi:uncharacterized protein [Panulirus ornatus]|uniref:uncharacterized protein n=1 Tax=Panulirus ornatus TaxID=150431 RepID=UPI003A83695E
MELKILVTLASFVSGMPKEEGMIEPPPATPMELMKALTFGDMKTLLKVMKQDEDASREQHQDLADREQDLQIALHPMAVLKSENLARVIEDTTSYLNSDGGNVNIESDKDIHSSSSRAKLGSYMLHPGMISHSNDYHDDP